MADAAETGATEAEAATAGAASEGTAAGAVTKAAEAVAGAASVIEQKYGISLQDSGSGYNFYNSHVTMWIQPTMIEVINRDFEKKEEILSRALREASKSQLKRTASDDGSDVL